MNHLSSKCYAIVPAAGRSRRMGQPKLLLPWGAGTLIDRVLNAWTSSNVDRVVVVIHPDDAELRHICERWSVDVIQPVKAPSDMKASIQIGLTFLENTIHPAPSDRCFIAPADIPTLKSQVIDQLIRTEVDSSTIVLPRFGDRLGHPALLPWSLTHKISQLADDEGVDHLIERHDKQTVSFAAQEIVKDVDTMDDYQQALMSAGKVLSSRPRPAALKNQS